MFLADPFLTRLLMKDREVNQPAAGRLAATEMRRRAGAIRLTRLQGLAVGFGFGG